MPNRSSFGAYVQNMSVPTGDSGATTNVATLMPRLQFRFRVKSTGFPGDGTVLTQQCMDCQRPTLDFAEVSMMLYNSQIFVPGRPTWNPITMSIRDTVDGKVSASIAAQVQRQYDFLNQSTAGAGSDVKFVTEIEMLDGGNGAYKATALETWVLYGCWFKTTKFGPLNYTSSEVVKLDLNIRYDNAATFGPDGNVTGYQDLSGQFGNRFGNVTASGFGSAPAGAG